MYVTKKVLTFWVSHFLHLPSADKGNEGLTLGRANKWGLCVWGNRSFLKIGRSMWLREKYGGKHCPRGTRTRISRERTRRPKRVKLDSCSTCVTRASTANSATHLPLSIPQKNIIKHHPILVLFPPRLMYTFRLTIKSLFQSLYWIVANVQNPP